MKTIVLATTNPGKVAEMDALFSGLGFAVRAQSEFNVSECEETGLTFIENALIKARHASLQTSLPAIADDSGLIVDALNGQPGIHSARFAGVNADSKANITKLLASLHNLPEVKRNARFFCAIVFLRHAYDATPIICQNTWEGQILFAPQGEQGFGYDPVFYVPTHQCSAAQLSLAEKNAISHRGKALQQLHQALSILYFNGYPVTPI